MDKLLKMTSDISLASALYSCGFPITGIHAKDPRTLLFYFDETPALNEAISLYWSRSFLTKYQVEPVDLFGARREIVSQMKEYERQKSSQKPYSDLP